MTVAFEDARARRYLLGKASDEECSAIEQEYLASEDALERIAAVEDELIEDYLDSQLSAVDRERFERSYLASPAHRLRVETVRRLSAGGARSAPPAEASPGIARRSMGWLAMAASLIIAASVAVWMFIPSSAPSSQVAEVPTPPPSAAPPPEPAPAPPAAARVFALTLSPVAVRSASDAPTAVVPAGIEVVSLQLESDADGRQLVATRAAVSTVGGERIWAGPVAAGAPSSGGLAARVDVPAGSLRADDYLVTLYGTDRSGIEREWTQYFLRVRGR